MTEKEKEIMRMMLDSMTALKLQVIQLEKLVRELRLEKVKNG